MGAGERLDFRFTFLRREPPVGAPVVAAAVDPARVPVGRGATDEGENAPRAEDTAPETAPDTAELAFLVVFVMR